MPTTVDQNWHLIQSGYAHEAATGPGDAQLRRVARCASCTLAAELERQPSCIRKRRSLAGTSETRCSLTMLCTSRCTHGCHPRSKTSQNYTCSRHRCRVRCSSLPGKWMAVVQVLVGLALQSERHRYPPKGRCQDRCGSDLRSGLCARLR